MREFGKLENSLFSAWAFGPDGNWRRPVGYWKPRLADHSVATALEEVAWGLGDVNSEANSRASFEAHGDFPVTMRIENADPDGNTLEFETAIPWQSVLEAWLDQAFRLDRADAYRLGTDAYGRPKNFNEPTSAEYLADAMGFGRR